MKNKKMIFILFLFIISTANCLESVQQITVAIIGTNDIHGAAFPIDLIRLDTGEKYKSGGLVYMGNMIQTIKNQYPGRVLYLDAGDQFQGGIQSSIKVSRGNIMNDFYKEMGLDGSAIGNHQFDQGPEFLQNFFKSRPSLNLASNLRSEKDEKDFLHNHISQKLYKLESGITIGVIGLATTQTPFTSTGFNKNFFPAYKFLKYRQFVIESSQKLKQQGANAIIIVSHVGANCAQSTKYGIWTKDYTTENCIPDQMTQLLDSLPSRTVDGVVQGHRHSIVHNYHKGIPIIGSVNGGLYFNIMYLTFIQKQIVNSKLQGPVPVCQKIFKNLGECKFLNKQQLKQAGPLVNWKFHNKTVYPHPRVEALFTQKWQDTMKEYLQQIVINQVYLFKQSRQQCQLYNLITSMAHEAIPQADFVIIQPGTLRTSWTPGIIEYRHLYQMMPFQNRYQTFRITGDQLIKTLQILQKGSKGFYYAWGLEQVVWFDGEKSGFIDATIQGKEIIKDKQYIGASLDFLLNGGDDFKTVLESKVYQVRERTDIGTERQLLRPKFQELGIIKAGKFYDENHLRFKVLNKQPQQSTF